MSAYFSILSARFRMLLQYRAAAVAGLATQTFWGFIRIMIFAAFFASTTAPQPMQFAQVVTYIWLGQAFFRLMPMRPDEEIVRLIRDGTVAYEMLRPRPLYWVWYTRSVAGLSAPAILRATPMLVLAGLFFGLGAPASPAAFGLFAVALVGALLLGAALMTLTTVSMLRTIAGDGITTIVGTSAYFLSGITVPIPLFPSWVQPVLRALPFRGIFDTPLQFYTGLVPPSQCLGPLLHQVLWIAGLVVVGQWYLARCTRRLVVQGG